MTAKTTSRKWTEAQRQKFIATAKAKREGTARAPGAAAMTALLHHMRKAVAHDIRIEGRVELLASRPVLLALLALAETEQRGRA